MVYPLLQTIYGFIQSNSLILIVAIPFLIYLFTRKLGKKKKIVIGSFFLLAVYIFYHAIFVDTTHPIPISICAPESREVIASEGINPKDVYICKQYSFDSFKDTKLINIGYGPAEDCIAGCIYNQILQIKGPEKVVDISNIRLTTSDITKLLEINFDDFHFRYGSILALVEHEREISMDLKEMDGNLNLVVVFNNFKDPVKISDTNKPLYYTSNRNQTILNGYVYVDLNNNSMKVDELSVQHLDYPIDDKGKKYCSFVIKYRDRCFRDIALVHKDAKLCSKIKSDSIQAQCFLNLATTLKSSNMCNQIQDKNKSKTCFEKVGIAANNPQTCLNSSDWGRFQCVTKIASINNNVETCKVLEPFDIETDKCIRNLSIMTNDAALCSNINDEYVKSECYYDAALEQGDINLCNEIDKSHTYNVHYPVDETINMKENCIKQVKQGTKMIR